MDWLNLHIPTVLRSSEFIGSEPVDRSTHIMLLAFCAMAENSGVICGCRGWKDRKWQQLAAVTHAEVRRECDLWKWVGDDLHVMLYPAEKEREVRMKREIAKQNGHKSGGRPRKQKKTDVGLDEIPTLVNSAKAEGEGEGERKENGKEAVGGGSDEHRAITLCDAHPKRDKSAPALRAAVGAIKRHGFEVVLAGVTGYAATVAGWTPAERVRFVKNAPEFFDEDLWNQPAANWGGRNGHTPKPSRGIDVGGRQGSTKLMQELYPTMKS